MSPHLVPREVWAIRPSTPTPNFGSLCLPVWLLQALQSLSIVRPTTIQEKCIPAILQGRNVVASAKTGSGKTAAFSIPILVSLDKDPFGIHSLILTPTRELAFQIAEQFLALSSPIRSSVCIVTGGTDIVKQAIELNTRPHIVVATPGRLYDILQYSPECCELKRIRYLVLDEADRLLETGFIQVLDKILKAADNPQILLFSATITRSMSEMTTSKSFPFFTLEDPLVVHLGNDLEPPDQLVQKYLLIPSQIKETYLVYLLKHDFATKTVVVFTGTCAAAEMLHHILIEFGVAAVALHSKMKQRDRIQSLGRFRGWNSRVLIATDVASRGLDIPPLQVVINYTVPSDPKDYVHRVGRTARAEQPGFALTIVNEMDIELVVNIEDTTHVKLEEYKVNESKVLELIHSVTMAKQRASAKMRAPYLESAQ